MIPFACRHWMPVSDSARALADALAQRQAKPARVLDLEVQQTLTASTSRTSGTGSAAACRRGREHTDSSRAGVAERVGGRNADWEGPARAGTVPHRSRPPTGTEDEATGRRWFRHAAQGSKGRFQTVDCVPPAPPCSRTERHPLSRRLGRQPENTLSLMCGLTGSRRCRRTRERRSMSLRSRPR